MSRPKIQPEMVDVFIKLRLAFEQLSKSQKKIASYILRNYEKAPDMAAVEIAKSVGVSEATVVRFATALGFDGYPSFRKKLQEDVHSKLTTLERIDISVDDDKKHYSGNKYIRKVLKKDIKSIYESMDTIQSPSFEESVKCIVNAKKVFILGFRTSGVLAEYLGHYLNIILDDVRVISHGSIDFYEQLIKPEKDDVVIAISFPRYAHSMIEAIQFLKKRGIKIIAVTDNENAPVYAYADHVLLAKSDVYSFVDSLVAPMSLLNAMIIAAGAQNLEKTKKSFQELEKIWHESDVYVGNNMDLNLAENSEKNE